MGKETERGRFKKIVRVSQPIFMALLLFLQAGCGWEEESAFSDPVMETQENHEPRVFGATYMQMNNPYFEILNNSIKEVVESNGDILITRDPAKDQQKQNEEIEEMIEDGVSAIFLNTVDWKTVKPALLACHEAGVPVFVMDTPVYDQEYTVSIIASDNYNAGVQCATDLMKKMRAAKIVVLSDESTGSIVSRIQGFKDTIEGHPSYEIVYEEQGMGELEVSMDVMNEFLEKDIEFDVVMGGNDPSALGALAALQANHMEKNVKIYGVDGSPDGKTMIKQGYMEATSAQSPKQIGRTVAEKAYGYLNGETIEKNIVIPVTLITKENLEQYDINGWQ